jgi:hypothetical protein
MIQTEEAVEMKSSLMKRSALAGSVGAVVRAPALLRAQLIGVVLILVFGQLSLAGGICTISGTGDQDRLVGTSGSDAMCGRGGSDRIRGRGGDDFILGGLGSDRARGGSGPDELVGGPDDDRLRGGTGRDSLTGDAGRDVLRGGPHRDCLKSRDGHGGDVLRGGPAIDTAVAPDEGDRLISVERIVEFGSECPRR